MLYSWSFGVVLHEICTQEMPQRGGMRAIRWILFWPAYSECMPGSESCLQAVWEGKVGLHLMPELNGRVGVDLVKS